MGIRIWKGKRDIPHGTLGLRGLMARRMRRVMM
jgi:hypothetical protein